MGQATVCVDAGLFGVAGWAGIPADLIVVGVEAHDATADDVVGTVVVTSDSGARGSSRWSSRWSNFSRHSCSATTGWSTPPPGEQGRSGRSQ